MRTEEDINTPGVKVPKKEVLESYYKEWLQGKSDVQIAEAIGVGEYEIQKYSSCFMNYCRYKVQFETRDTLAKYGKALQIPLTDERRKELIDLIKHGVSIAKASRILNIPIITIYDYWYIIDPMLRIEVETAVDAVDAKITKALAKRAMGYKVKNRSTTTTEGQGADGPINMIVTSVVERDVPADVNAAKFWLINRTPEKFTLDGNVNRSENKGRIIEFLDQELQTEADRGAIPIESTIVDNDESDI